MHWDRVLRVRIRETVLVYLIYINLGFGQGERRESLRSFRRSFSMLVLQSGDSRTGIDALTSVNIAQYKVRFDLHAL